MVRRCLALTVALAALAVSAAPAVAAEGGTTEPRGNSEAAKLCQQDGSALFGFENAGECISFAAQGGTLVFPSFNEACAALGFDVGRTKESGGFVTERCQINFSPPERVAAFDEARPLLEAACTGQGGEVIGSGRDQIFCSTPL